MIWQAVVSKLRTRGPLGFATDALELAASMAVIGTWVAVLGAAAVAAVVATAPVVAWELLMKNRQPSCDPECYDRDGLCEACRNAGGRS